ncbi:MAG: type IX secretion system membrane protein PorP/SprF, partial [Bacteroidota bacterium]
LPLSDDISLMPAILIKYVANAPLDADINLNLDIKQKFTVGTSYRMGGDGSGDSIDMLAFWQATPRVGVGVAYDFTLSRLKDYNGGSFEVLLQADLKQDEKLAGKKKMTNPRFFM